MRASARTPALSGLHVQSGTTTVTTARGLVTTLLGKSIVAFVTAPGVSTLTLPPTGPPLPPPGSALVTTYPVTGGHVGLKPPTGIIRHSGGLLLVNVANGKFLPLDNFIIDIASKVLTAHVVDSLRVTVFNLDLSHVKTSFKEHVLTITQVGLKLDSGAATALNAVLSTRVFTPRLSFGTARAKLVID